MRRDVQISRQDGKGNAAVGFLFQLSGRVEKPDFGYFITMDETSSNRGCCGQGCGCFASTSFGQTSSNRESMRTKPYEFSSSLNYCFIFFATVESTCESDGQRYRRLFDVVRLGRSELSYGRYNR